MITIHESWFYLSKSNGKRRIQYISRDEKNPKLEVAFKRESNAKRFMVWAGVSFNGKTSLHFVEPRAEINSKYYINNVLKKFLARDARRLYTKGDFLFHQGSAPSHTSGITQEYMRSNVRFIQKKKWIHKSPDAAPINYFVWVYLKPMLWSSKPKDKRALKRAYK